MENQTIKRFISGIRVNLLNGGKQLLDTAAPRSEIAAYSIKKRRMKEKERERKKGSENFFWRKEAKSKSETITLPLLGWVRLRTQNSSPGDDNLSCGCAPDTIIPFYQWYWVPAQDVIGPKPI